MYNNGFSKRLAELRHEKGVSAREMSLSLGQSESYINKIENNYAMPSMSGFFYICEYLDITPQEFFDFETARQDGANIKITIQCHKSIQLPVTSNAPMVRA